MSTIPPFFTNFLINFGLERIGKPFGYVNKRTSKIQIDFLSALKGGGLEDKLPLKVLSERFELERSVFTYHSFTN